MGPIHKVSEFSCAEPDTGVTTGVLLDCGTAPILRSVLFGHDWTTPSEGYPALPSLSVRVSPILWCSILEDLHNCFDNNVVPAAAERPSGCMEYGLHTSDGL